MNHIILSRFAYSPLIGISKSIERNCLLHSSRKFRHETFASFREGTDGVLNITTDSVNVSLNHSLSGDKSFSKPNLPRHSKHNGRFISPWTQKSSSGTMLKWMLTKASDFNSIDPKCAELIKYMNISSENALAPANTAVAIEALLTNPSRPQFTWMGHSSCYYQTNGLSIITDPIWSERCSPFDWFGPKRSFPPPIDLDSLKIDVVLISHTHYDHLDASTADRIGNRALWIVPLGVKKWLEERNITNCIELDWWESHNVKSIDSTSATEAFVKFVFTPTKHWTSRTPFDKNTCLWGSFAVLSPSSSFFFAGDTAYCDVFKTIGEMYGPFDLSAIPIGAYKPRYAMSQVHCDPEEAIMIANDLKSKKSIGIHWGTFPLADEFPLEPALELAKVRDAKGMPMSSFFTTLPGEVFSLSSEPISDFSDRNPLLYSKYLQLCD